MTERSAHHPSGPGHAAPTHCVVLTGPNRDAPGDLLRGLSLRGVGTVVVSHPASVMVELSRQTTGAVVVVEPDRHPYLAELLHAIEKYHPRTTRWQYTAHDPSGTPQLRPMAGCAEDGCDDGPEPISINGQSRGKYLVPDPKSPLGRAQAQVPRERVRSLVVKVHHPADADEPLISEEELAMLLGPSPEEIELDTSDGDEFPETGRRHE